MEGPILAKWETLNDEQKKDLGAPYDNQKNTWRQQRRLPAVRRWRPDLQERRPGLLVWGKIRDAWNDDQASQGKLGYPTADEMKEPDGTYKSTFEHGTVTWKEGDEKATVTAELAHNSHLMQGRAIHAIARLSSLRCQGALGTGAVFAESS